MLGKVVGRIDHLGVDLLRKRLLVAELGNNSVAVVDLTKGVLFKSISGLREPQGVAYAPKGDLIYVADAGDGAVDLFKADDLTPTGKVDLRSDADNIRADADRMIVGYGGGALAVLDAVSGKKLADIAPTAHPESFQLDPPTTASTSICRKPSCGGCRSGDRKRNRALELDRREREFSYGVGRRGKPRGIGRKPNSGGLMSLG